MVSKNKKIKVWIIICIVMSIFSFWFIQLHFVFDGIAAHANESGIISKKSIKTNDGSFSEDADYLAGKFIEVNNLREGIEIIGGPFNFRNYERSTEESTKDSDKGLSVSLEYVYKEQNRIPGDPERFDISYEIINNAQELQKGKYADPPIPSKVIGKFEDQELRSIIEQVMAIASVRESVCNRREEEEITNSVTVDINGKVVYKQLPALNIHSVEKLASGQVLVLVNANFDHVFEWFDSRPIFTDVELEDKDDQWQVSSIPAVHFLTRPREAKEQKFLFRGKIDQRKLSRAVDICRGIAGMSMISAVGVDEEGNMRITAGQRKSEPIFGNIALSQPRMLVRLERAGNRWNAKAVASIDNVYPDLLYPELGLMGGILFFNKPGKTEIEKLKKELRYADDWLDLLDGTGGEMKKVLSEDDIEKIAEITLRTRGLMSRSHFILHVWRPDYVWAATDDNDFAEWLTLLKMDGKWIMDWKRLEDTK